MKIHNGVQLRDDEYEELLALAEAADNGEDVMLAAFMRLCPTGQEGAFDEAVVAAYATLAEAGFIEGVQEGGEFFFEDITPAGRSLTNPAFAEEHRRANDDESALFGDPIDVVAEDAQTDFEILHDNDDAHALQEEAALNSAPSNTDALGEAALNNSEADATSAPHESPFSILAANPALMPAAIAGAIAGFIAGAIAACIIALVL